MSHSTYRGRLASVLLSLCLFLSLFSALLFTGGEAEAADFFLPVAQADATAEVTAARTEQPVAGTPEAGSGTAPPPPLSTVENANPIEAPNAEATAQAQPVGNMDQPPVQTEASPSPGPAPSNEFPWLFIAIPVALLGLLGLGLAARSRKATPEEALLPQPNLSGRVYTVPRKQPSAQDTVPLSRAEATYTAPVPSTATSTASAPVAPAASLSNAGDTLPTSIECPNCQTENSITENFCRECGDDLRPARNALLSPVSAASTATAVPAQDTAGLVEASALASTPTAILDSSDDIATDDMPFLETLDRADEQLEYVLSRPHVILGTALDSDIVIDSAFTGWETVSPQHAELQRDPEGFLIRDRDSAAGTFVNEQRTGESILADGDRISLGDVSFVYRVSAVEQIREKI